MEEPRSEDGPDAKLRRRFGAGAMLLIAAALCLAGATVWLFVGGGPRAALVSKARAHGGSAQVVGLGQNWLNDFLPVSAEVQLGRVTVLSLGGAAWDRGELSEIGRLKDLELL